MKKVDVVILGGGISGLGCRAGLTGARETLLLEGEDEAGGILRTYAQDGYRFDTTLHVLFFRHDRIRTALESLLPQGLRGFVKQCAVWAHGRRISYPYQYHAAQLPASVRDQCLAGYRETRREGRPAASNESYRDWLLSRYGTGFYEHFFKPYNEKLYGVALDRLEAAPMTWTLPRDDEEKVLGEPVADVDIDHPSTHCFYPRGPLGMKAVVDAMAALGSGELLLGTKVAWVDPLERIVGTADGRSFRYAQLVSSLPLPRLVSLLIAAPGPIAAAARALRVVPVTTVQVGAGAGGALPEHWTYFPDRTIPFYRMTRLEAISPDLCPSNRAALLLECSGRTAPRRDHITKLLHHLHLIPHPTLEVFRVVQVPAAYVLFRHNYRAQVDILRRYLDQLGIRSIGRYGTWGYSNVEGALVSGLAAAAGLCGGQPSRVLDLFGAAPTPDGTCG